MIQIVIESLKREGKSLKIEAAVKGCAYSPKVRSPRLTACFACGEDIRRIPLNIYQYGMQQEDGMALLQARQSYDLEYLFHIGDHPRQFALSFALQYGPLELEGIPVRQLPILSGESGLTASTNGQEGTESIEVRILEKSEGEEEAAQTKKAEDTDEGKGKAEPLLSKVNRHLFRTLFRLFRVCPVKKHKVFFLSNRRSRMSGNMEFVYRELKKRTDRLLQISVLLKACDMKEFHPWYFWRAAYHAATAKVILVDDSCNFLDFIDRKRETSLIQLWHACGAFKTFGYSRLGKAEGTSQRDRNHRFYTHAIVSSQEIARFYAEGFGISPSHVEATGIPRTDVFFDKAYRRDRIEKFYKKYPQFQGKQIILFAPTFRGWDKEGAYYPMEQFDIGHFLGQLGEEYVLLLKHHPYIQERHPIPREYQSRVLDMTQEEEINDLLFVTDVLITDYSSVIFEAALLDIPMLFYAYDLEEYIRARDFYYEYEDFVPGRIVASQEELEQVVRKGEFGQEKIPAFKRRFFDHLDGGSAKRVADLVLSDLGKEVFL